MGKRETITLQTRQNLVDAFWELYCEKRVEKITVKDITERAGYNRGTFYEYFRDTYDVLEFIEQSMIPTVGELPPVSAPMGGFGLPLELFMELYAENQKYYAVLLGPKGDPAFAGMLKNAIKPVLVNELLQHLNVDSRKLDYILEYVLTAMIGMMSYWFSQEDPIPKEEMFELMQKIMEEGVFQQLMKSGK